MVQWQYQQQRPALDMTFIEAVLERWQIKGAPLHIEDLGGAYNRNWHVKTPYANVVIRVRPPWLTRARIEGIHDLIERLNQESMPTPHLRRTKSGRTFDVVMGQLVEVYDYLSEAHDRSWTITRWQSAFEHMARLHRVFNNLHMSLTPPLISNYVPPNLMQQLIRQTTTLLEKLPDSADRAEGLAICQAALKVLLKIEVYLMTLKGDLPRHLVHGDYHLDNLLFDSSDHVRYTLDFDFAASRDRIFEIAYALRLALPQLTDNPNCFLDSNIVQNWIDIYSSSAAYPLTQAERKFLPYYLAYVSLYYIGDACRVDDPLTQVLREATYLELADHLVQYPESLLDGIC